MLKQTNINIMHSGIINKTKYDYLEKPMKQKAIHYNKEKFQI